MAGQDFQYGSITLAYSPYGKGTKGATDYAFGTDLRPIVPNLNFDLIWQAISSCSQFFLSASRVWMSIWSHQSSYSEGKGEFDFYTLPKRNYETDMTMSNWFFVCLCCIQLKVSILLFSAYTHWVLGEYWYLHFDSQCSK